MLKRFAGPMGMVTVMVAMALVGCAGAGGGESTRSDSSRLEAEEFASMNVSTLYDAIRRLRPRWLEARSTRSAFGGSGETEVLVFMDRTLLGGVDELRRLGLETAAWIEHMSGSDAQAQLPGIAGRHVDSVIRIHTVDRRDRE